jgi:hypothetical protein
MFQNLLRNGSASVINVTDAHLRKAEERGREVLETEPRASAVQYDRTTDRVVVELANGYSYVFPVRLVQDLHGASQDALADVEVDGAGLNLHWPTLDVDLYVPALVSRNFGKCTWMTQQLY